MLLTKEIDVTLVPNNVQHYKNLGYEIPMKEASELNKKMNKVDYVYDLFKKIKVKTEDLSKKSSVKVDVLCDYCKETVNTIPYSTYTLRMETYGSYYCPKCQPIRAKETMLKRYGVDSYLKTKEGQERIRQTNLNKYGVPYITQSKEVKEKIQKTNLERYGYICSFRNEEVQNKYKENNLKKYGVEFTLQLPEVREKINKTLYKNNSQKSSKQQRYINNLFGGELNYPYKYYSFDIYLSKNNIDIEYDGGGHKLNILSRRLTEEEYDKKELARNYVIRRAGYKQIRIVSSKDYLPSDEILLQMLEQAKEYFNTTNHTWVEYNIDTSLMRNAEHKEGVFFDYGGLRKIS